MSKYIKNNLKILVTLIISAILFTGIGVYAATQYYARDISFTPSAANQANGFDATNVEDALNQLYDQNNKEYITWLIVEGNVGAKSQLNLFDLKFKKFSALQLKCLTSNSAKVTISNSSFDKYNTVELNKEYDISSELYRLYIEKTSGNGWCQVQIKLK